MQLVPVSKMKRLLPFVILVATALSGCAESKKAKSKEVDPVVQHLYLAAQAARARISSGTITYERDEYFCHAPEAGKEKKELATLQFKRDGDQVCWRLSRTLRRGLGEPALGMMKYQGPDSDFTIASNGLNEYRVYRDGDFVKTEEGVHYSRFPLENAGIASIFLTPEAFELTKKRSSDMRVRKVSDDCIELNYYTGNSLIHSATFSLSYDGLCLGQKTLKGFGIGHPLDILGIAVRYHTSPESPAQITIFSDYQQVSGVWYPMDIQREVYEVDEELTQTSGILRTRLSSRLGIKVLSCKFNIPPEDELFPPASADEVRD